MQIIFGLLEKISFHNEENDFVVAKLRDLCSERILRQFRFHPLREIQVLTPMHKGNTLFIRYLSSVVP